MANTAYRGPLISLGALMGNVLTAAGALVAAVEPYDGMSIFYQSAMIPDPRYYPANKDAQKTAAIPGFMLPSDILLTDQIPSTTATNTVAAAQTIVAATPMTLVTTCAGGTTVSTYFSAQCAAMVPMIPMGANVGASFPNQGAVVNALALDFGFSIGSTTAGSASVTAVPDTGLFTVGQWVCIGGAGKSDNTTALIAQITAIGATTLTISPAALGTLAAAPIGSANGYGPFPGGTNANPTAANPYIAAGFGAVLNPMESLSRGVYITCNNSSGVGGTFTVAGYDVYGQPMTEAIPVSPASSLTVYGKKAFKYIKSITPANTDATYTYAFGTSDVIGLHLRAVEWDQIEVTWNGSYMSSSTGYLVPDRTTPATTTTGDVRGTIQVSNTGGGTGITGNNATNSSRRFTAVVSPQAACMALANPNTPIPLFGVKQV